MRHGRKINHLSRKSQHRHALLSNLAASLIFHKRIHTTLPKAKALRVFIEPLIHRTKNNTTHSRRMVFRHLDNKQAVAALFRDVAPKVAERNGGYTRILKTGFRPGDGADICLIELVDFNETYRTAKTDKMAEAKKTRRGRGGKKKQQEESAPGRETNISDKTDNNDTTEQKTE